MASHRIRQVNELIKQELGKIFLKEVNLPQGCLVTITEIITSRDLGQAKVLLSIIPTAKEEEILNQLSAQAGRFQFLLGKIMVIRKVPKIIFKLDLAQKKASHINELLDKIHQED